MWVDSSFIENVGKAIDGFSNGEYVDTDKLFSEFKSEKYLDLIDGIKRTNEKMLNDRENIELLLKDSNMMNQGARDGSLDIRIDEKQ
ncbi:MAG: hypothetical protein KAJ49_10110, partial [Arcobacteraceae bacterium]|nr:hypothetical protein [Arcobacteraceae bacterium]